MAELLVAARNLPTGYFRGEVIAVVEDGHTWGNLEGPNLPPNSGGSFAVLQIPGLPVEKVRNKLGPLYEDAQPGDPEFDAPDPEDRRIYRGRRAARLIWQEAPAAKRANLLNDGIASVTEAQARSVYRKLTYNRGTGEIEETAEGAIDD